ncbi:hypothetical protein BC628DRAFT_1349593 [Trametes gibbosa]|nr:hypothetical protein BC628DRAFT_1349593 [Trametes gibbosa]
MVGRASESERPLFIPYHHHPAPPFHAHRSALVPHPSALPTTLPNTFYLFLAHFSAMAVAKKAPTAKSAASKKSAPRAPAAHPTWLDMIKECIVAHPEDARQGVSRPQIKKFVEETYKLDFGAAQTTQLSRAITSGAEKGVFVLPKGPSGRVKLPPKSQRPAEAAATKENKPDVKPAKAAPKAKAPVKSTTATKAAAPKKTTTVKKPAAAKATVAKPSATKKAAPAKATTKAPAAKPKAAAAASKKAVPVKKAPAKKVAAPAKKTSTASKRESAKKSVTGKAPVKKTTSRAAATKTSTRTAKAAKKS